MNLFIFTLNLQCIHVFDFYNFTVVFLEKSRLQLKFWERRIGKGVGVKHTYCRLVLPFFSKQLLNQNENNLVSNIK